MPEIIESIVDIETERVSEASPDHMNRYEGYQIVTTERVIDLIIGSEQNCCEKWGYLMSEDDLDDFIGAELHNVTVVDTALNVQALLDKQITVNDHDTMTMFVNLETSHGTLQFVAYNMHNGYYGHRVRVEFDKNLEHGDLL